MRFLIHTGSTNYNLPPALTDIGISPKDVFQKPLVDMGVLVEAIPETRERKTCLMDGNSTIKVLTIDDEDIVRENIAAYLEDNNYTVFQGKNGKHGIEVFREVQPDIVLLDLRMPEMDGIEVLKLIREESDEIPVIMISGTGVMNDAIEALRVGAWDYIVKPIQDMAVLEHALSKSLERAALLRENRVYREHLEEEIKKRTSEIVERDRRS